MRHVRMIIIVGLFVFFGGSPDSEDQEVEQNCHENVSHGRVSYLTSTRSLRLDLLESVVMREGCIGVTGVHLVAKHSCDG
jgi:hypothetical protein